MSAATLVLAALVAGTGAPAHAASGPCGTSTTHPSTYQHVIWIWFENHSYRQVIGPPGSPPALKAPYTNSIATQCGLATGYRNVSHPSLPNYIAATSGGTQGITNDCAPSVCPRNVNSLYAQVTAKGLTWKAYQEGMTSNCKKTSSGRYVAHHNPAVYYTPLAAQCATQDVPMGTTTSGNLRTDIDNDTLPAYAFLMPDLCNSTHDCSITTGDDWLASWLPLLLASPAYQAGGTAIFVTWDEGAGGSGGEDCTTNSTDQSCHVPMLVISPSTVPGTRKGAAYTHYSLLKTTEQLLGLTQLGAASSAFSMRAGFGL